jgi:hypothetical protein
MTVITAWAIVTYFIQEYLYFLITGRAAITPAVKNVTDSPAAIVGLNTNKIHPANPIIGVITSIILAMRFTLSKRSEASTKLQICIIKNIIAYTIIKTN